MSDSGTRALVLSIDDDAEIRDLVSQVLGNAGYEVVSAADGPSGLRAAREHHPGLILLDIMMPGMNGYRVCDDLQTDPRTSDVPVIFLTALSEERDRARAFALGATDYLVKPFNAATVVETVRRNLATAVVFRGITEASRELGRDRVTGSDFMRFKDFLIGRLPPNERVRAVVNRMGPADMYAKAASAGVDSSEISQLASEFLGLEHTTAVAAESIRLGVLPAPFCRANLVVPVETATGDAFVVANPFDLELQGSLASFVGPDVIIRMVVADPRTVLSVLGGVRTASVEPPPAPATLPHDGPSPPARTLNILIVDDDPDAQAVNARIVQSAGHHVMVVPEGASALVQLARHRFDLVLADIAMPTLGGFALLDVMRKQGITTPVVFVTGSAAVEDEEVATRMGAAAFLSKPVSKETLLGAIEKLMTAHDPSPDAG
ncbi:MAG: response regulator [Coriobacteriia bacterium]|nr:response regulator [Coriobacteriia bacterium]